MPVLTLVDEPAPFDIRACPIWAIPQLAELRRRLSGSSAWTVKFLSFKVIRSNQGVHIGEFIVDIPGEDVYYGYLSSVNMKEYRHPAMSVAY